MDSYITTERQILKNKYTRFCLAGKTMILERKQWLKSCRITCIHLSAYALLAEFWHYVKIPEIMIFSSGITMTTMWSMNENYLTLQNSINFQRLTSSSGIRYFSDLWLQIYCQVSYQEKWKEEEEMKTWSTEITTICTDFHKARFLILLKSRVSNNHELSFQTQVISAWTEQICLLYRHLVIHWQKNSLTVLILNQEKRMGIGGKIISKVSRIVPSLVISKVPGRFLWF